MAAKKQIKTHYSDKELDEFKTLIDSKLEVAKTELNYLQVQIKEFGSDSADTKFMSMDDGAGTLEKEYLVSTPLGSVETEIASKNFIKVHRSYVVNISKIDAIGENKEYLILNEHSIPISRRNREEVLQHLRLL